MFLLKFSNFSFTFKTPFRLKDIVKKKKKKKTYGYQAERG